LADSGNAVLEALGLPAHPADAYRYFVGLGVGELVRSMLPESERAEATLKRARELLMAEYTRRWKDKTRPYPGIAEMLAELNGRGLPLCVLSNKPQDFTEVTVHEFFPGFPFTRVFGARAEVPRKPHPAGALAIAGELGLSPGAFCFVGDSATDMKTARGAGMLPIGVLWGFRTAQELTGNGAALLISRPEELAQHLAAGPVG
jgi:phosphoglycolate phosphatase